MLECSPLTLELLHYCFLTIVVIPNKGECSFLYEIHGVIHISHAEDLLSSNRSLYGNNIHQDYFIEIVGHYSFGIAM
jgi:hypothetical protein